MALIDNTSINTLMLPFLKAFRSEKWKTQKRVFGRA